MSYPPALPAPGGNATAALALVNPTQPEEVVIHSGAATTEGDMSYLEEDFDPCRHDPRRNMPGVLDANLDISQLNTINFNQVDNRTAQVAVVQQGVDPTLASELMVAQQQAFRNEANALHSEVMERQRQELVSEARDQLASVQKQAADEISRKNLLLNEQAAQAMSEQKSAQLHVHAQDHRIRELSAELSQVMNNAGAMTSTVEKSNADLQNARSELAEYRTQIEAMNQYNMDMKRMAESQKKDFEAEIAKLRDEQKQLIRSLKSQPLEGTSGPQIHYGPGKSVPQASQPSRLIIEGVKSGSKPKHSSDADDEHITADPGHPPGLPGGQPPDDDDDDDFDDKRSHKDKKDKRKGRKTSRGRSRRRRRKDPSSSPSSSSPSTTSGSGSESSFARKVKRALERSRASDNKAKESDRILVPKFPQPENYRNWRIRVRDAVIAASSKPDLAFQWVEEVFKTDQSVEALKDSGKFVTLDAKLMSSLTNICEGDFARQLDIFKEEQAKSGTPARGRQALLMIHKHFSTSRKHGAVYDIEDLMAVTLVNDDLRGFITRWDAVIAGMTSEPDMMWKQAYFHNAIKNFKPLSHDLAVYDRTPEGEPNRSYDFLMKAARDYLERKRLEKMRQATKKSVSGKRDATPAPTRPPSAGKPTGICYDFQAGKCTRGKDCRYKHEKVEKGKGGGKKGKSRSKSRGTSRSLSPGSRNQVCKFWKAGKCQRGNDCAFQHPPKPAAASTKDDKRGKSKKKKKNKKKGDRSRSSSRGSNSSRGSQSLKDKGGKQSSSGSAAVCLMRALMMVAVVNPSTSTHRVPEGIASPCQFNQQFAMPVTPNRTVSFGDNDEIFEVPIEHHCNLHPCQAKTRTHNPVRITGDDRTRKDTIEARESDAILAAQMLQSAVFRELHGKSCKCNFACDSDIGCRHCIRSDLNALPGHMPSQQRNATAEIAWIADTGSAQDLVCSKMIPEDVVYHSHEPLELITANGSQSADQQASVHIDCIDKEVHPYVLPDTPAVISVGMRCIQDGWDFVWKSFSRPYFRKKDGTKIKLEVKDYVPYLPSRDGHVPAAVGIPFSWDSAAGNGKPIISPVRRSRMSVVGTESEDEVQEVEEPYEASIADDEILLRPDDEDLEEFFPGELAPGPPAAMTPDDDQGSDDEVEAPEEPVDGRLQLPEPKAIDRGEAALREEARSLRHMMTHTPKNPFCETCKCAKMYKPTKRSKGESLTVESNKFGDHITGDHLVTRDANEQSVDGDRVAMVMKDVATNFRWVYPSARSHAKDCVLAFRHFIAPGEEVGVFYSDAAPSIKLACREVGWRQNTSVAYVSKSNAVAERNLRSVLEGTRVNLEQAGLHHSYWSYAARHWCMAHNIQDHPEILSPWELRFGEKFKGPNIPFGARIDYWTGPKLKPKKDLRFDPTSNPGVFLGYAMQPGFIWRNEYLVASLKDLMEKEFNEAVQVVRVNQLTVPDGPFVYPLKGRYKAIREGLYDSLSLEAPPDPRRMDAQTIEDLVAPRKTADPGLVDGEEEFEQMMREAGLETDDIEVINPKTGSTEMISKDDPSYYDSSGFKGRRYKGSSKPEEIPTFLWRGASKAARERAKREALLKEAAKKHDAAVAKENKYNRVIDRLVSSAIPEPKISNNSDDFIPAMPVTYKPGGSHSGNQCHRDKLKDQSELSCFHFSNALVARPVGQKEINNTPAAQAALDKEWNNLTSKGAWDYSTVREWDDVSREAIKNKTKVHVGKIFEICVEKGSELPQGDPMRKFKGRTVFQGNNVKDEAADVALFAELGSSPANMEAGKALDAYGSMPGNRTSQGDGKQAYTQALMQGILTWIRLPRNRWPKEWIGVYKDPVVLLVLALYGHPDSGGLWQRHCEKALYAVGFHPLYPECWPSMFWHPKLKLLLGVYVDDFKMSGPSKNIDEGWKLISSQIDMDTPEDAGRYLGCEHVFKQNVKLDVSAHPFAHVFDASIPDPSSKPASPARRTKDYWEHMPELGVYVHHHLQPRKKFQDKPKDETSFRAGTHRLTVCEPCQIHDEPKEFVHDMESQNPTGLPFWWTGSTYFVGLPSSCLWSVIRHAGGDSTQQKQARRVETRAKTPKDDYWEHVPFTNQVTRVHVKPRNKLYNPTDSDCPVNFQGLARQRYTIMKTKTGEVEFDLTWDWTTPDADMVYYFEWTGKTIFRIPGPNEVDYGVESREIRSALTDFQYIGSEKRGDESVYMAGPGSLEVIFLEDNQATIRILESGRSPSFRHTDKTQRLNLSWLSEQFKRKHFRLVYVGSSLQAADILTKPFTNSEKWESALRLMGISSQSAPRKEPKKTKARAGEPVPSTASGSQQRAGEPACPSVASHCRVLIEFCCGPDSKLGDRTRKFSKDCYVIRCTEDRDVTSRSNRMDIRNEVANAISSSTVQHCPVLVWISIPCTGGTTWSYVNLQHESAKLKVEYHRHVFEKIWSSMVDFLNLIRHFNPMIAIEWPAHCVYWKFERVEKFCIKHQLVPVAFDGCMVGIVNKEGISIKKPWSIKTDCHSIVSAFDGLSCDGNHDHVQGRGSDLKETETYSFQMTDMIHQAFIAATSSKTRSTTSTALCVLSQSKSSTTMAYFRRFPEAEVKEADYTTAADAAGIRPGEPVSEDDNVLGPNAKAWIALTRSIFCSVTQCRVVNESDVISDLSAMSVFVDNDVLAKGYLKDVSPEDARLLDGISTFSLRAMACPGEPEANFVFAGDSSLALVDMVDGFPSTRRNIGEYIKEKPTFLPPGRRAVWHDLRWGRGLPDIIKGVEHSLDNLQRRGTSRPAIVVISYAGNDIFGNYGFIQCEWLNNEMACYSQKRRDAANEMMEERVNQHFSALNDLVKLTTRPDVGNIVLIMPWYGRGYGLHPDYDRQMIREAEALRKRGLCVLDATSLIKCTSRYDGQHMENNEHNRLQCTRFYSEAACLGYHLFRLRSCKGLIEVAAMKKRREESQANPLPENNPQWEEMEEVLVSVVVDGWEIYVKETRPKGQRLENEIDPEKAQIKYTPLVKEASDAGTSTSWDVVESVDAELPGEPEHFEPHEAQEPDMDGEIIDAMLKPFLDKIPGVSDERDIDDPDDDEEIVFRDPIVGGSAAHVSQRKLRSHQMNKIHAVDFRLDGSGIVNILDTDVTRDPSKLELRQESTQTTEDGTVIIRRFDLNDEEKHKQMEREIFEEPKSAEEKLRTGDPAASMEIVSKAKAVSKAAASLEVASGSGGVAQIISDSVGAFIKPPTKEQGTMISHKKPPQLPKPIMRSTGTGASPVTSPKPSPPPTPKSSAGSPKPEPPALPAEAVDQPMAKSGIPYKAPPPMMTKTSPRAPPQKSAAPMAAPSTESAPKVAKTESAAAASASASAPPGTGGPQPPAHPPHRPEGYPKWYFNSPGTGERRDFTVRCNDLPGLRDLGRLSYEDFRFAKRISGLLRGYDHKSLLPHHRIIPPDFDAQLFLNFEGMYAYLKKRYRGELSRQDLYLLLKTQDRFLCRIESGVAGELTTLDMPYRITHVKACQGHDQTLIDKVGTAPLVKQVISLDYQFGAEELGRGYYPRVPIFPHLAEAEVAEEFRMVYHYTSWDALQQIICTGIFPGASSCKGHVYMTRHAPWEIEGKDPGVRTNRPLCIAIDTECALHYGIRLVETLAGALICEDWIPNHVLVYAYDCEKCQYLWANHGYNGVKKFLKNKAAENALGWEENEARKGSPDYEEFERFEISDLKELKMMFTAEYIQWKDVVTLKRPLIYKTVRTPYDVVDELLPKHRQRPLDFKNMLCVARKPSVTAAGFDVAPDDPRERRSDRFDQEAFDPTVEGNLTRWRYASVLAMPELTCPRCRKIFPEGMLICLACGLSLATMSDMRRACQIFRLEELANKLGFELTLDMLGDDDVSGATQGNRQVRSAAAVLKNHARSYMKQARKAGMTLLQRLGTDAHYAFNCAVQDLSPACMHYITILGNIVLPTIRRTAEEIRTGKVRQYKARMCLIATDDAPVQTIVVDDHVLIWFKNRFYRANQFAAAYALLPIQDRFEVLSEANQTFQSLALSQQDVYADILRYVDDILRPLTEAKDTEGGSRPLPATRQRNPDYTRSSRPGYGSHQGPSHGYTQQEWNDFYNQWTDQEWEDWRRRNQGHQYRDRRWSGHRWRHRGGEPLAWWHDRHLRRGNLFAWGVAQRKLLPTLTLIQVGSQLVLHMVGERFHQHPNISVLSRNLANSFQKFTKVFFNALNAYKFEAGIWHSSYPCHDSFLLSTRLVVACIAERKLLPYEDKATLKLFSMLPCDFRTNWIQHFALIQIALLWQAPGRPQELLLPRGNAGLCNGPWPFSTLHVRPQAQSSPKPESCIRPNLFALHPSEVVLDVIRNGLHSLLQLLVIVADLRWKYEDYAKGRPCFWVFGSGVVFGW